MRHRWDYDPPINRATMRGTDAEREAWWRIRCWLKPRAFAVPGMSQKRWNRVKRTLQQTLRDEGYDAAVAAAERVLHRMRTEAKETPRGDNPKECRP
jgi:hypothetical protein